MSQHLKIFSGLMYASLVFAFLTCLTEDYTGGEIAMLFFVVAVVAALVWLAAHKESRIAACLLGTFTVFAILILIADISGGAVLSFFASDPRPTTGTLLLDVVAVALMSAAMAFYFFSGRRVPQA